MNIRIEPEFENKIPPLTEDEYRQLEENIRADGIIINPIITWNGAVVDGHNRFRIAQAHPEIRYTTFEKSFPNAEAAVAWICKHQLGRRNLTPEQKKYLIGKQYEAEKASHGGDRKSEDIKSSCQNVNLKNPERISDRIARENGVSSRFVTRAGGFSKAVDMADEAVPGIRNDILSGKLKPTEAEVRAIVQAAPGEREALVEELRQPKDKPRSSLSEARRELAQLRKIGEEMAHARGGKKLESMLFELSDAVDTLIFRWKFCISNHQELFQREDCRAQILKYADKVRSFIGSIEKGVIPDE